jgi:hypothetical protein
MKEGSQCKSICYEISVGSLGTLVLLFFIFLYLCPKCKFPGERRYLIYLDLTQSIRGGDLRDIVIDGNENYD